MERPLVSVVLPIYNVEKYLDRCIVSVMNQSYQELEIILIDDGSVDSCPAICEEWAHKDSRIKVLHKQNAGLGYARNSGIALATGKYICFFDSDDYIEPETVAVCVDAAERENADIVCFGNDVRTQAGRVLSERVPTPPRWVFSGEDVRNQFMPNALSYNSNTGENWNFSMSAWSAMYSMEVIRRSGWQFVSEREIISEDIYSVLDYFHYVQKAVIVPKVLYHYITNPVSLSRVYREDRYEKVAYLLQKLRELSLKNGCSDLLKERISRIFLGLTIGVMKQIVEAPMPIWKKRSELMRIMNDRHLQSVFQQDDFSREELQKRILFCGMRKKKWLACYLLLNARNMMGRQQH